MEDNYIFHEGPLPSDISKDYEEALFNLPSFNLLQDPQNWQSFYVLDRKRKKAAAGIHFHIENRIAHTPFRAPFGSVEFSNEIRPDRLFRFFEHIEIQLSQIGVSEVFITNPPRDYERGKFSLLETFLPNQKYQVVRAEVSALIAVTEQLFSARIRHSEKLRLQQAQKAALIFRMVAPDQLDTVYDFLLRCHSDKDYKISMTLRDLKKTVNAFPDRYLLFVILEQQKIVAACISIRVKKNILYNFLANHEKEYNALSPLILLMDGVYNYCRDNQITILDLGTSALQGRPNFKLLDFKMHLGGLPSSKLTFYKKLN